MKLLKVVGLAILFITLSGQVSAQRSYLDDADHALYEEGKYFEAIEMYKKAYVKEAGRDVKAEIIFKIAESYRLSDQTEQAEVWYDKSIIAQYADPIARFQLAEMKMQNGNYDEALVDYQKYAAEVPSDSRGKVGVEAAGKAQKWKDNPENYIVEPAVFLNSEFSDYATTFADKKKNQIIFTSTREGSIGTDISAVTGDNFSDLYHATQDKKGKWSEPGLVQGEEINTEAAEGAAVLNSRKNAMYFTRCNVDKNGYFGCQILTAKKQGLKFATPVVIAIASDSATIGHPALTPNDKVLIFASDLPGGQGGKDLWYIKEESRGKWSQPINLGAGINTPGDEMFPYVRENGDLYFASNGHPGLGGLDIFIAKKKGDTQWGKVNNMKAPINSNANDFAIIFKGDNSGMFTSSREGGKGKDDIWTFYSPDPEFKIIALLKNLESGEVLSAGKVQMIGTDGSTVEGETDAEGQVEFDINMNTSYVITASKPGYLNAKGKETTVGQEESKIFAHLYELQPVTDDPIKLPEILYAFNSTELTEQAKDSLQELYSTLIDNPTIVIELKANTDSRGGPEYNQKLSQGRAESAVNYLISLGIEAERMVPKGYGENNLLIADAEINKLATEEEREAAHQLNRRTEFSVLSFDFVPKPTIPEIPEDESGSEPIDGSSTEEESTEE
jgi:peptidoglycan-associated lipoprotein